MLGTAALVVEIILEGLVTDIHVIICLQLDTKGIRSVQYFPAKELENYVALWDHIFNQVSKKFVVGFVGEVKVHVFFLVGGRHVAQKRSVGLIMLDSSSSGDFSFPWKQKCIMRSAQTSNKTRQN